MFARIALGVVAVVVLLLVVVATRPATFHIERSAKISAPPDVVFAQLVDLHRWEKWNPFEQGDPTLKKTFNGVPATIGSSFHYVGDEIGEGLMTVTDAIPNEQVAIKAEFIKPFAATNEIEFTLEPIAGGVSVNWAMSGSNNFVAKAVSLFMDMDGMIGGEFEKGLVDLKHVSEEEAARHTDATTQDADADDLAAIVG